MATVTASQMTSYWNAQPDGWLGSDGTWTIKHPSLEKTLFVNGDTAMTVNGSNKFPNHTLVIYDWNTAALDVLQYTNIMLAPKGQWYWGGEMAWDYETSNLWMFSMRLATSGGGFGFSQVGRDICRFCWPNDGLPTLQTIQHINQPGPMGGTVDWGGGVANAHDKLYIFGAYQDPIWPSQFIFGYRIYAARVDYGKFPRLNEWEFLTNADGWRKMPKAGFPHTDLKIVLDEHTGPSATFSADVIDGIWKFVSKKHGDFGSEVTLWETDVLGNPATTTFLFNSPYSAGDNTYGARAHFELPRTPDGKVLVSVNHNKSGTTLGDYFVPPYFYRPQWEEFYL